MSIITHEIIENKYREAVRNKYNIEKEGAYSHYLNNPTQANLRDLCWEIFKLEPKPDDLSVYRSFFRYDFNKNEEDVSIKYTDKFRKVRDFYLGRKNTAKNNTIDLAAILIDFEPRPYRNFEERFRSFKGCGDINSNPEQKTNTYLNETVSEKSDLNPLGTKEVIKEDSTIIVEDDKNGGKKDEKQIYLLISGLVFLILVIIYIALPNKKCMQWSSDHYELVDCDLKTEGFVVSNPVELLDESLVDLKKVKVCDTTKCFDKNGNAIIWYAKTANGIEFFNGHGRHPENNNALRPVTQYIFDKYVKK